MRKFPDGSRFPLAFFLSAFVGFTVIAPCLTCDAHPLLKEIIIAYNQKAYGESLQDGSYKGEEGLLRIAPEVARSFGLAVLVDSDYLDGKESFQKAERYLEKAKAALVSQKREKAPNEHAQQALDAFLSYKKALESGRQKMMIYRSKLNPQVDERLIDSVASILLEKLLTESLRKNEYRLRDALAQFYNDCHGINQSSYPMSSENVGFVNEVFGQFRFRATPEISALFDLDRESGNEKKMDERVWRFVLEKDDLSFVDTFCAVLKRTLPDSPADPLLFLALMKRESGFDPFAVSRTGAAGLTQIMPQTALDLGMRNVFKPAYLEKAFQLQEQERKKRSEAMALLSRIASEQGLQTAATARELMQESLACAQEKERYFARYRNDLLQNRGDDRFKPSLAIEHGLRYFARLLQEQEGDISLALAAYNAGPHRVREYKGIPPFTETVLFRNKVSDYYREFLRKAGKTAGPEG